MLTPSHARRYLPLAGFALGLLAFTVGCDSASTQMSDPTDDALTQNEDIDDPYGGYSGADELVGFADDFLLSGEGEIAYRDPVGDAPEVAAMLERVENDLYAVRIAWGHFQSDSSRPSERIDWSGSATVDEGAIIATRTIQFEQNDYIVHPRDSRLTLEWESHTTVAFDGIQMLVLDPQPTDGDSVRAEGNTLRFEMPLWGETYEVALLDGLEAIIPVGDLGHEVRIDARKVEITPCGRGWMSGRWEQLERNSDGSPVDIGAPNGAQGVFRGHWVNLRGDVAGYMRGFYGINASGHRVLFGKLISMNGDVRGLMRGTWRHGSSPGAGRFVAHWLTIDREVLGGMRGVWERRGPEGGGFYHGGWRAYCGDAGEEVGYDIDSSVFGTSGRP